MTDSITVYSKPACQDCLKTKAALKKRGLSCVEVDVEANSSVAEQLRKDGYKGLPVVKVGRQVWTGHQPEKIEQIRRPDECPLPSGGHRMNLFCRCGKRFIDTASGRHVHKMLFGHAPQQEK